MPIHSQRCQNCQHLFKLNHKPKKVKYPFLGEPLYALEKVCFYKLPQSKGICKLDRRRSSRNSKGGEKTKLAQMRENECLSLILTKTRYYGL